MKYFLYLLLFISITSCDSCVCRLFEFQPDIKNGGRIVALSRSPNNNSDLIAAAESGGLFISKSGGRSWQHIDNLPVFEMRDVQYASTDPKVILASARIDLKKINGGGIWKSKDGGKNWYKPIGSRKIENGIELETHANGIAFRPQTNSVFVGTNRGIAISHDNGETWNYKNIFLEWNNVYDVVTGTGQKVLATTDFGIFYSIDNGNTWLFSDTNVPNTNNINGLTNSPNNQDHCFYAASHYRIYFSPNFGKTWDTIDAPQGGNRAPFVRCFRAVGGGDRDLHLYYGNGVSFFRKKITTNNLGALIFKNAWENLAVDHADQSDVIAAVDSKTPLLLSGDGGVYNTIDNGANWKWIGGGKDGLNALQITEVTAQKNYVQNKEYVYFGTQDNYVWASEDGGNTYTKATGGEGFSIQTKRHALVNEGNKMSFVTCGDCSIRVSEQYFNGEVAFTNVSNVLTDPVIWPTDNLDPNPPNRFIQIGSGATAVTGLTRKYFYRTYNAGANWTSIGSMMSDPTSQLAKISNPAGNAVLYQPVSLGGVTPQGLGKIGLIKLVTSGNTVQRADLNGFGSLGTFPTMFKWYNIFAVNPRDPNHLIIADVANEKMKISRDGGQNWVDDDELTDCVTNNGAYQFYKQIECCPAIIVNTIEFHPEDPNQIAVGTRENGVFYSWDGGDTWYKLDDTDKITNVSSIFFYYDQKILISTYGRGIFKLEPKKPTKKHRMKYHLGPHDAIEIDFITGKTKKYKGLDSMVMRADDQIIVLSPRDCMSIRDIDASKSSIRVYPLEVWQNKNRIENDKERELKILVESKEVIRQITEIYNQLPIRLIHINGNNEIKSLIVSKSAIKLYSDSELELKPYTDPLIVLTNPEARNPYAIKKGIPMEISGYYFKYDVKHPVEIYVDQQLITTVPVDKNGNFTILLPNAYLVPNGLRIRAIQNSEGKILEDVKFIQLLKERE